MSTLDHLIKGYESLEDKAKLNKNTYSNLSSEMSSKDKYKSV